MTRRSRWGRTFITVAVVVLSSWNAVANHTDGNANSGALNPIQLVGTTYPYYSYSSSIIFDVSQPDHSATIKNYEMAIPSGWNLALNSIDPSSKASCGSLTSADLPSFAFAKSSPTWHNDTTGLAERVGSAVITVHTDATRASSGAVPYTGYVWFLNFDDTTKTTTLCALVKTGSSLIDFNQQEIMFEVRLKYNPDGSFAMTWNYAMATGGNPATPRSIFDNSYYTSRNASILYSRLELNTLTSGNWNRNPAGKKAEVRFVWNPKTPGLYTFTGTYYPCTAGDPGNCVSSATPAVRTTVLRITDYPSGYHPGPVLTAPAFWSVLRGGAPLEIKWKQPATRPDDPIKGYVVRTSADYIPNATRGDYIITDPGSSGYVTEADACASDPTRQNCVLSLSWPVLADNGQPMPVEANFSTSIVTLFKDGHRSDGNCDNGTAAGSPPPCPDGTAPATVAGTATTQFMHRQYAWPLVYRKILERSDSKPGQTGRVWQVYVLLADLDARKFQYVEWKPGGLTFSGTGPNVIGSNVGGGAIAYTILSGPYHWTLNAVLNPVDARGVWIRMSSANEIQNADRFDGCNLIQSFPFPTLAYTNPCPKAATTMPKI